jgi:hypothetical protein
VSGYGLHILPQHAAMLQASAIDPDVARERGYVSADSKKQLERYGFASYQQRAPALLIPVHDVTGAVTTYQLRADNPRVTKAGKSIKYETRARSKMALDVPPRIREQLGDPKVPLWITEGARKADAAVSAGLCCIALMGVSGWRGSNGQGGKTALADWQHVSIDTGRRIYLAFDSDVMTKASVHDALSQLGGYLGRRGADVRYVYLPDGADGAKVGLDDYLAAGGSVDDLVTSSTPQLRAAQDELAGSTPSAVTSQVHTPPSWVTDQDILGRLLRDMGVWCGFTGEHRNARLTYLAITSRILDDPVSIAVKGLSSSGKSYTVGQVLRFFPADAYIAMTAMSERALIYMEDDFAHKTLVLYEAVALREEREKNESNLTAYIVRSLLSEGEIRYPVAMRGADGKMVTRTIVKEGPTNFIVTTTATSLHGENETRMISLPTDDSAQQTTAIMRSTAGKDDLPEGDFAEWHAFARWVAAGNKQVVIPYATWLADNIPPVAVRLRRDFRALLRLIQAHAIIHQLNRGVDELGRIIATEADYLAVRTLVADLITDAVGATVLPSVRETVETIEAMDDGQGVKVHDLAAKLGLERSTAQYRVSSAKERGYLVNVEEKRGRAARYRPGNPLPDDVVILPERIGGVNPHPEPGSHPGDDENSRSDAGSEGVWGCEPTAQGIPGADSDDCEPDPPAVTSHLHTCTVCGHPLDKSFIDYGFTECGGCEATT